MNKKNVVLFALALLGETVVIGAAGAGPINWETLTESECRGTLLEAVFNRNFDRIAQYLENGGDPNFFVDPEREITLLMLVIQRVPHFVPQLMDLFERSPLFDPNIPNVFGGTAASVCIVLENPLALERLIKSPKFDPNTQITGNLVVGQLIRKSFCLPELGPWRKSIVQILNHPNWNSAEKDVYGITLGGRLSHWSHLLGDNALIYWNEKIKIQIENLRKKIASLSEEEQICGERFLQSLSDALLLSDCMGRRFEEIKNELAARGAEVQVSIETLQEIAFRYIWDDNRSSFYFKHEEGNPKRIEEEMVQAILNRSEKLMDTIPDGQGQGLKQLLKHFVSGKRIEINALSHRDWTRQNVDLLIREITEAEKRNNEAARRALIEAVLSRNVKEVRVRLEKGGNPNCVVDPERKETLLMWTIEEVPDFAPQFVDLLKEFLSFDPNVADSSGDTAAHMCVRLGAVPTLEALMELPNFDPNVPGKGGQMLVDRCMRRMIKNPGLWGVVFIKLLSHGKIEPGTRNRVLEIAIYRLDCLQRCLNDLLSEDALNKTKEFLERGLMKVREKVTTLESDRQDFALEVIDCLSQITTSLYREMPAKTMLQAVQTGLARLPNPYCRNSAKILRGLIRMMENKNALQEIGGVTKALKEMKANILAAH